MPLPPELSSSPPDSHFDKYIRSQKLGAGGMGEVWKAWDTGLDRWVALKFLKGAGDDDEIARFKREAQLAGKLSHPNIAAIYDVGTAQERPYIAMQFVEGQTLKTLPRADRRLLARLIRDAALAVQFAHEQGVIHRDLKPDNIMVTSRGHLYVMDFGLARSVEGRQSISGMVVGTPVYMPPEQARGERADERADVYSLGATLYELLTDRAPFKGASVFEILASLQDEEPKPPRRLDPAIDADLETIVLKCLEKDRDRRYPTAAALAADLTRWQEGEAISARPASLVYRLRKRLARRKALVALTAIALVALLVGGGYGLMQAYRTHTRETRVYPLVERARELVRSADAMLARPHPSQEVWTAKLTEAEQLCRDALRVHSEYAPAHLVLGLVEMQRGEIDRAIAAFDAALAGPDYEQARLERVKAYAERIFLIEHETVARGAIDRTQERRWFALAQQDLARVRPERLEPEERIVVELLGFMLKDDLAGLRARLKSTAGEADERAWRVRGEMEHRSRRYGAAIEAYRRFVDLRRGDARGVVRLAHMLFDADLYDESVATATRAIAMRDGVDARLTRGRSLQSRGDFAGAIADYDRALELRGGIAEAHLFRAGARHALGDAGAMADFDRAIELNGDFADAYSSRGMAKQARGDAAGAVADCNRAIELASGSAAPHYYRGCLRFEHGDLAGAIADHTRAIELDQNYPAAHLGRGSAKQEAGDLEGALADFSRAIELKKGLAAGYNNRAAVKTKRGDPAGAITDADKAIELKPDYAEAYVNRSVAKLSRGDATGAAADADRALSLSAELPDAYAARGSAKRTRGDAAGAIADFDKAIALAKNPFEALYNRGNAKQDLADWAGAIADYDRAVAIKGDSGPVFNNRGNAKKARGDLVGAIADFDRAIALKPDNPEAHYNRGNARQARGDFAGATADYDRAIALRKDYAEAYCNRGTVKDARGDARGAIADYDRAIDLRGDYVRAYVNRGMSRLAFGQEREALADFDRAIELRKDYAPAFHARGFLKKGRGDGAGAVADFDRAIELKADFVEAWIDRGLAKMARGETAGAIADYDRAIELKPEYPEPYYNRALARKAAGDVAGAIADCETALRVAPASWPHRKRVEQTLKTFRDRKP